MERSLRIFLTTITLVCLARAAVSDEATCNGSVAECGFGFVGGGGGGGEEMEDMVVMESWISQRILEEQRRISYGALRRNQPACDKGSSGDSYSDSCLPPPSNPYSRGCSKHYRCRSDS